MELSYRVLNTDGLTTEVPESELALDDGMAIFTRYNDEDKEWTVIAAYPLHSVLHIVADLQ